ncbi:MAG: hypothetical protein KDA45_03100 [Planctomycetales bacterium]|nr:hypothetical protein [Planctomycetales bacterium]
MSSALVESPVAASQLYFSFSEPAEWTAAAEEEAGGPWTRPSPATASHASKSIDSFRQRVPQAQAVQTQAAQTQAVQIQAAQTQATQTQATQPQAAQTQATQPQATTTKRVQLAVRSPLPDGGCARRAPETPVRLGAVMLQLLKSYGVTDQEIEEGLANYAQKNRPALAS